jgi:hypothetical protein
VKKEQASSLVKQITKESKIKSNITENIIEDIIAILPTTTFTYLIIKQINPPKPSNSQRKIPL